jgi:hypothetical protein
MSREQTDISHYESTAIDLVKKVSDVEVTLRWNPICKQKVASAWCPERFSSR